MTLLDGAQVRSHAPGPQTAGLYGHEVPDICYQKECKVIILKRDLENLKKNHLKSEDDAGSDGTMKRQQNGISLNVYSVAKMFIGTGN